MHAEKIGLELALSLLIQSILDRPRDTKPRVVDDGIDSSGGIQICLTPAETESSRVTSIRTA